MGVGPTYHRELPTLWLLLPVPRPHQDRATGHLSEAPVMFRFRRTTSLGVSAAAATAAIALGALPASALTPPVWPTGGRVPSGPSCTETASSIVGSLYDMRFTDAGQPSIDDVFLNGAGTAVVPPGGAAYTMSAKVSEPCSGAAVVEAIVVGVDLARDS